MGSWIEDVGAHELLTRVFVHAHAAHGERLRILHSTQGPLFTAPAARNCERSFFSWRAGAASFERSVASLRVDQSLALFFPS